MAAKDITTEMIVDMAWRTEGLVDIMRENNDPNSDFLELAQLHALTLGRSEGLMCPHDIYQVMETLADRYRYDSGSRKYDKDSIHASPR